MYDLGIHTNKYDHPNTTSRNYVHWEITELFQCMG